MFNLLFILCVCLCADFISAQLRTNFHVKSFNLCPTTGPAKYYGNVTTEGERQYLNLIMISPVPMDDNIAGTCNIETLLRNNTYIRLFEIREKSACKALNKYMGEFWYDIERAAQVPHGVCPILAGRYAVHHHFMDFKKITLQTFPFGTLKFTFHLTEKSSNQLMFCLVVEAENIFN